MHFGAGKKIAIRSILSYIFDLPEEGLEEFIQEVSGDNFKNYAARKENAIRNDKRTEEEKAVQLELAAGKITDAVAEDLIKAIQEEYPDLDLMSNKEILKGSLEAFKGGVEGAIALGFIPAGVNTAVDTVNLVKIKELAAKTPSEAAFNAEMKKERTDSKGKKYKLSDIISKDDDAKINAGLHEIYQNQTQARDEVFTSTRSLAEVNANLEGRDISTSGTEQEIETEDVSPVIRNAAGELDTENVTQEQEDGTIKGSFRVGTASKEKDNLYGYADYTISADGKIVTIDKFKMDYNREGLRGEVFDQFAQMFAGKDIQWNAKGKLAKEIKNNLIKANLNGKNKGLNYYRNAADVADAKERTNFAKQVRKNVKNISEEQVPYAVSLVENMARSRGMSFSEYVRKTFVENYFGDISEAEQIAQQNGNTFQGKAGAAAWKKLVIR